MKKQTLVNYLKKHGIKVNQAQAEAVADMSKISILECGPGTGKSATIIAKVAWISHLDPTARILCLSFSKKAVNELQMRLINTGCNNAVVLTFHSWMLRQLKTYDVNYRHFSIVSNDAEKREMLMLAIANAHMENIIEIDALSEALAKGKYDSEEIKVAANEYLQVCKDQRKLCFDSIAPLFLELLDFNPNICRAIRSHIDWLNLDEVQDNSLLFFKILSKIFFDSANNQCHITMVGNIDQSIYAFRGADVKNYHDTTSSLNATTHTLNLCYRSVPAIVNTFNAICPSGNIIKAVRADNGIKPVFHAAENPEKEARFIIDEIQKLHESGMCYSDMTVLFRSSPAVSTLLKMMLKEKLPVVRVGADPLYYSNSRFKCLLALLSMLYDPNHSSLYYGCALPILSVPSSIITYLGSVERGENSLQEILLSIPSMSRNQKVRVKEFFSIDVAKLSFDEVVFKLWNEFLKRYFKATDNAIYNQYLDIIGTNTNYTELRDEVLEYQREIKRMHRLEASGQDSLKLYSIHGAKGLQFKAVFLAGANEGILPCIKENVDIAEESRICYVALSRAEDYLYVTYPKVNSSGAKQEASRFLTKFFK